MAISYCVTDIIFIGAKGRAVSSAGEQHDVLSDRTGTLYYGVKDKLNGVLLEGWKSRCLNLKCVGDVHLRNNIPTTVIK